jgi:hypothetical protein
MASALLADGRSFSINYGEVKGIPDSFVGQMNVGKLLRENLPGSATLKQSAGRSVGKAKDAPHLLPEGEPRHFQFSNPDALMTGIANVSGGAFDKLRIEGMNGTVSVRKNEPAKVVLAKVHFEAGPTGPAPRTVQEMPLFARFAIANPPTVDGVQPRNWSYGFDLAVDGELHTLQLRPLSTALRSVNLPQPLSILGPTEELTILAPLDWLILTARPNEGPTTGTIEGQFVLRDFPELGPPVTSRSVSVSFPSHTKAQSSPDAKVKTVTVGRNEKCPCGSGKKFKRCHGI